MGGLGIRKRFSVGSPNCELNDRKSKLSRKALVHLAGVVCLVLVGIVLFIGCSQS